MLWNRLFQNLKKHWKTCLLNRQLKNAHLMCCPLSACLREAPPCGAKAGAFLGSLRRMAFFGQLLREEKS
jgi:hypothetical protein